MDKEGKSKEENIRQPDHARVEETAVGHERISLVQGHPRLHDCLHVVPHHLHNGCSLVCVLWVCVRASLCLCGWVGVRGCECSRVLAWKQIGTVDECKKACVSLCTALWDEGIRLVQSHPRPHNRLHVAPHDLQNGCPLFCVLWVGMLECVSVYIYVWGCGCGGGCAWK